MIKSTEYVIDNMSFLKIIIFRPQMPPTAAQPDFAPARSTVFTMPSSLSSGGIQYSGSDDIQFPEDVQDEANSYFEKIYR